MAAVVSLVLSVWHGCNYLSSLPSASWNNVDWEFGKTYNRLYEKEKMKWEGEFTLRSDP